MIATRTEEPHRIDSEDAYALRRILVRRLQRASRGLPRRLRAETHRQFVREWKDILHRDRLDTLLGELARGRQAAQESGSPFAEAIHREKSLLLRLAFGLGDSGTLQAVETAAAEVPGRPSWPERAGSVAERVPQVKPALTGGRSEPRQAELFESAVLN